jgi:hypothetical protein
MREGRPAQRSRGGYTLRNVLTLLPGAELTHPVVASPTTLSIASDKEGKARKKIFFNLKMTPSGSKLGRKKQKQNQYRAVRYGTSSAR